MIKVALVLGDSDEAVSSGVFDGRDSCASATGVALGLIEFEEKASRFSGNE